MIAFIVAVLHLALFGCTVAQLEVTVTGEAAWQQVPFAIRLLESVAAYDESLYEPALRAIFSVEAHSVDEDDEIDEIDESDEQEPVTDYDIYQRFLKRTEITDVAKSIIDFHLTYNMLGPRVSAHYSFFHAKDYASYITKKCATDSFGVPLEDHQAWVQFKDEVYCSNEDLFALKTDSVGESLLEPFDRIIGTLGPVVVLYGEPSSKQFLPMLKSLILDSDNGKLRFVIRYVPPITVKRDQLIGYSFDFKLEDIGSLQNTENGNSDALPLRDISKIDCSQLIPPSNLKNIGLKISSYVLGQNLTDIEKFELLKKVSQSLPCYLASVAENSVDDNVKFSLAYNENKGMTSKSNGFYINGSPINRLELDVLNVFEKVKKELAIIQSLHAIGLSNAQAKYLIKKFALISAVKDSQYRSGESLWGSNTNRFRVYENRFNPKGKSDGGVVFFNNIEEDQLYERYSKNADEIYLGPQGINIRMGQIPPLRENIHDLIFAINLEDKDQLRVFFSFAKIILDKGLVHQLGILPLKGTNPSMDVLMATKLYSILKVSDATEALGFLYAYYATRDPDEEQKLFDSIEDNVDDLDELLATANQFSLDGPSIIFSGVIHSLHEKDWQLSMAQQILHDVKLLQTAMKDGKHEGKSLKSILYENAKSERVLKINPANPNDIKYKLITEELISKSVPIRYIGNQTHLPASVWLIGDFTSAVMLEQLTTILKLMIESAFNFQVRLVNTSTNDQVIEFISSILKMTEENLKRIVDWLEIIQRDIGLEEYEQNQTLFGTFERSGLNLNDNILLVNSRVLDLDEVFSEANIRSLLEFESSYRLSTFDKIFEGNADIFNESSSSVDFMGSIGVDYFDWFDMVTSIVTNSFYSTDDILSTDVSRYDFDVLDLLNSIIIENDAMEKEVDILLILDPLEEYSQEMLSLVNAFIDFKFAQVQILLQSSAQSNENQVHRFYFANVPRSKPVFGLQGNFAPHSLTQSSTLPANEHLTFALHVPRSWEVYVDDVSEGFESQSFSLEKFKTPPKLRFVLDKLLVEGFAMDVDNARYPSGLVLSLNNNSVTIESTVLSTLGYFQFAVCPGLWNLTVLSDLNTHGYSLVNNDANLLESGRYDTSFYPVQVYSLDGLKINPKFTRKRTLVDRKQTRKGWSVRLLLNKYRTSKSEPEVNIFTVISGRTYERLSKTMILSVMKNTKHSVKFWIIGKYLSPLFKKDISVLSGKYHFEYEFVGYQWPSWLRAQELHHREVWAYKILFLDVLFPQSLSRIIYIDADLTVRSDLKELVDLDLEGAPYGFTPMCEDREDMKQYRFWESGYWEKVLGSHFKYHISAMFVVDLGTFRQLFVGHYLRDSYQKLSSDPNSLANLDQDLPNNLQHRVPIFSLPSKWLWCESWCSPVTKKDAAIIDMCNNPATSEAKTVAIKRIVPEWVSLEREVNNTLQEDLVPSLHDEL